MKKIFANSLLARTTVMVLGISFLVGSLFSGLAYIYFLQAEQERAVSYTAGLLDTVEDTMQIACYLSDKNLAKDVVDGIGKRREVKTIRISNSKAVLAEFNRKSNATVTALPDWLVPGTGQIHKTIYSPFNLHEPVCQATIELSQPEIRNHSNRNAGFIAALLLLEMIVLSVVAGSMILLKVIRPIQKISRGLHKLNAEQGQQLPALSRHRQDELGTLIDDINLLISDALASVSQITIVADITARDAFIAPGTTEATPKYVFVIDATADNRVTSGGATYLYNNDPSVKNWILVSMANDIDMAVSWDNLSGKPSSSPSDIDNAVSLRHSHANKTQLDKIGEDANGLLTYDGVLPLTGWQSTSW